MTATLSPVRASTSDRATILACLARIRRRLWAVRLLERCALALTWAAIVAICLTFSRVVREASHPWSAVIAAAALAPAVLLWLKAHRVARFLRGNMSIAWLRAAAVTTAALAVGGIVLAFITSNATLPILAVPIAVAFIFLALAAISVRMIDARAAAIFVDQQAGLEERVATALEMLEQPGAAAPLEAAFRAPVVESAVAACHQVKRATVGYHRLDQRAYALAALAALAAVAVLYIPPMAAPRVPTRGGKFTVVADKAKTMAEALREIESKKLPNDHATADKVRPLQNALNELKTGTKGPMEEAATLEQARAEMKRDQDAMNAADNVQKSLKDMQALAEMGKAGDSLKDAKMREAAGDGSASAQQQAALKAMQEAAEGIGGKLSAGGMSDEDKNKLAANLKAAAAQAGADPQLQRDLQNAAGAAEKGDGKALSENLQSAGQHMAQQQSDKAISQDAVNRAMDQIDAAQNAGKSAAEQQASQENQGNQGNQPQPNQGAGQANTSNNPGGDQQPGDAQANGQSPQGQNGDKPGGQKNNDGQGQDANGDKPGDSPSAKGNGPGGDGQPQAMQGSGSTNREQKGGPGDQHEGGPINKPGTFVQLYDQRVINSNGATERVQSKINPLGPAAGTITQKGLGDLTKSSIDSYANALPAARQRAMDDLNKQEIPPQYQDMVKAFYEK